MRGAIPGFSYDARRKVARFEVVLPGTASRKRIRKTFKIDSREAALAEWKRFRESALAGVQHTPLTLREFVDRYWERITAGKSPKTSKDQLGIINGHLLPAFGSTRLDRINAASIRDFTTAKREAGYAAASIDDYVRILVLLLHQAVEREEIASYPVRGRRPRQQRDLPRLELNQDEKARFLAAFEDESGFRALIAREHKAHGILPDSKSAGFYFQRFRACRPIFVIALETGLRKGDLLGLNWSSVNLVEGLVFVKTGKTGQDVVIPMSRACREAFEEAKARHIVGRQVFVTEDGKPLPEVTLRRYFAVAKVLAGITRRFRFHDLRHTFGSTLASAGVPLQIIAKALGHSSTKMSERYARPSVESLKAVANALDREETNSFANSKPNGGER